MKKTLLDAIIGIYPNGSQEKPIDPAYFKACEDAVMHVKYTSEPSALNSFFGPVWALKMWKVKTALHYRQEIYDDHLFAQRQNNAA